MLVTFERLIAIKFTMKYSSNIITDDNMRRAVLVIWIIAFINGALRGMKKGQSSKFFGRSSYSVMYFFSLLLVTSSCIETHVATKRR